MLKAFFLIFEPVAAWDRIIRSRRSVGFILAFHLLPALLIIAAVESWGLVTLGKWQPAYQKTRHFLLPAQENEVVFYGALQLILTLISVVVIALVIQSISGAFRLRRDFRSAFTVVAYGLSPMFLLRLLDAAPKIPPWVPWTIGIILSVWVLYQGLPRILEPDPTHAFGLYLSSAFVMALTTGVFRLLTALYILGRVSFNHSWLSHKFPALFH